MLELVYDWSPAREFSGRCMLQDLWAKSASVAAQQCILCSPDPSDQSCTADLSPFSFFLYPQHAPFPLPPPPFISLPAPRPSSLYFLLCHCSSCSDAHVVRGNTPKAQHLGKHANLFLFQPFFHFLFNLLYSLGRWLCQQIICCTAYIVSLWIVLTIETG